jgi:hypothetical protein
MPPVATTGHRDGVDHLRHECHGPDERQLAGDVERGPVPAGLGALGDHEVRACLGDADCLLDGGHHRADGRAAPGEASRVAERERQHGHAAREAQRDLLVDRDLDDVELPCPGVEAELRTQRVERHLHRLEIAARAGFDELEIHAERSLGRGLHFPHGRFKCVERDRRAGQRPESAGVRYRGDELGRRRTACHRRLEQRVWQRRGGASAPSAASA